MTHSDSWKVHSLAQRLVTLARWARDAWLIVGVALLMLMGLEMAYRLQAFAKRALAGTPATPAAHPYADSTWYAEYRKEYDRSTRLEWRPYVYYRRPPFIGRQINIDSAQHRITVHAAPAADSAPTVLFFGGSTMWGDYQRDAGTIPSVAVSRLAARGVGLRATNFGESGYVMTQSVLELILQLRGGERPDLVVFYDGINDVASAVQSGTSGIPQNEFNRAAEFRLGRAVRGWEEGTGLLADLRALGLLTLTGAERSQLLQRLLLAIRPPAGGVSVGVDSLAAQIIATYAASVDIVESLSAHYGFDVIYAWQPNPHVSLKTLTDYERGIDQTLRSDPFQQRLGTVHRLVAERLPSLMNERVGDRFVDLTHVFEGQGEPVWLDVIGHTTETAAARVAAAIAVSVDTALDGAGP